MTHKETVADVVFKAVVRGMCSRAQGKTLDLEFAQAIADEVVATIEAVQAHGEGVEAAPDAPKIVPAGWSVMIADGDITIRHHTNGDRLVIDLESGATSARGAQAHTIAVELLREIFTPPQEGAQPVAGFPMMPAAVMDQVRAQEGAQTSGVGSVSPVMRDSSAASPTIATATHPPQASDGAKDAEATYRFLVALPLHQLLAQTLDPMVTALGSHAPWKVRDRVIDTIYKAIQEAIASGGRGK